ncbi:hypothetical protein [Caldimonas brevitalea]|uniref:Uncharacterized protein n=1 Tax=Caldimonas brevitalea TaxID=413882 RepID=A0A0G3BL37_9BURK|nr:hypothetical protein [Caldimonas brevitalea]AKJ30164.1 hypothetical protein AAW51_3473 [Caldimonas brevitalea]
MSLGTAERFGHGAAIRRSAQETFLCQHVKLRLVLHAEPYMSSGTRIQFDPKPDPLEQKVRLVCGALLGVLVAGGMFLEFGPFDAAGTVVLVLVCILGCALGALQGGDRFWTAFLRLLGKL